MNHVPRTVWLLLAFAVLTAVARAEDGFPVEPVGARQGLNTGIMSTVFVDRQGFVWTATGNGLVRFDGYSTRVFSRDPSDPTSLSDNIVRKIYEDRSGRLWIGTHSGGLNLLDRVTGSFARYRHDPADPGSISHDSVYAIVEDRDGVLWVGTQNGLNRFDPAADNFERLMADVDDPQRPGDGCINALHEDGQGALWLATNGGLNRRDPATGTFTRFRHDPDDPGSIDDDAVLAIAEGADGALWVGTQLGLNRLERDGQTSRRYTAEFERFGGPMNVGALAVGPPGTLWVGTLGSGLFALDISTGELRKGHGQDEDIAAARVLVLHATPDAVYAATWGHGLKRVRLGAVPVETVLPSTGPGGVQDVSAVLEDRDGTRWLGLNGGQLCSRDPADAEFRALDVPGRYTFAIAENQGDDLWYGGVGGLGRIDRRTGESSYFVHDHEDPQSIGAGFVAALLTDSDGRLWVGTSEGGLQRMRADGQSFERFVHDPADPSSLSDNYVTQLHEDSAGTLWVGTSSGLNACDRRTVRCVRYQPDPEDPRSLDHHDVSEILEDRTGKLWIGTSGGGVNRLDDDGFQRFGSAEGLPGDGVRGMVEDDDGSLWISTRRGLTRFDPVRGRTMQLGLVDGLPSVDFYHGTATRGRDRLYFGTPRGLVTLPAGTPFPDPLPSPTVFTSIRNLRGTVPVDLSVSAIALLRVPYGEVLSFEFAVLDFDTANRHQYRYRMARLADEWIDLAGRRDVTFTDLSPGSYTLEVSGRNAQGEWSERSVDVRIIPPFWMTGWFRAGLLAIAVGAMATAWRLRVATFERRHRELRALTRRIETAKENERKCLARELHDEMGQMLSATKINLQMLPDLPDESARAAQVDDTVAMVDQLLTHVRALSLDLSPPFLDEVGLGLALRGYLEKVAERAGIEVRIDAEPDLREIDREVTLHAFRLVQESTTNVIRHADASRVDVRVWRENGELQAVIRDDGRGFDVEDALRRSHGGHHLGLLGMRERAQSLGGRLTIDSRPGSGTEIRFRLPLH